MSLDQPKDFVKPQAPTRDRFLGGKLTVAQPRHGFRAGLDSVLLGAAVRSASRSLLDLGAGVGTAAMVAMAGKPGLSALLAELDPATADLARENLASNGFGSRAEVANVDVTAKGTLREAAGLLPDRFDTVIANPPFFDAERGTPASERGETARHMQGEALDLWVKTAAASVAPGGEVIFIHTATALPALLAAFDARLGGLTLLPLSPRPGEAASRLLIRGIKGSRAQPVLLATLPLHGADGHGFSPRIDAILKGIGGSIW